MKRVATMAEVRAARSGRVGFVPTMGAFHEGHLELMRRARAECDQVIVSLFVNPTQFGPNEDYSHYPRQEERDAEMAAGVGVDVLFVPEVGEIYGPDRAVVTVEGVTEGWEGAARPVHFAGVATVVAKLFGMVHPSVAYFGLKDLQQCAVIRAMVRSLYLDLDLRFVETVREANGLAMSSRNAYLSPEERDRASVVYRSLRALASDLRSAKPTSADEIGARCAVAEQQIMAEGLVPEYVACVEPATMQSLESFSSSGRAIAAARLGRVRLLDNVPLDESFAPFVD